MTAIRVMLVEDHELVRAGLTLLIEAVPEFEVVGEAADGATALKLVLQLRPDVVVVDLGLPVMSGVELATALHSHGRSKSILVLTANDDPGYVKRLMQLGAGGYVHKRSTASELIQALYAVARGERYLAPNLVELFINHADSGPSPAPASTDTLSDRERDVLRLIAEGLTNKEIAARLDVSIKTVETYKSRAMQKLELRGRAEIVRYAVTAGWLKAP